MGATTLEIANRSKLAPAFAGEEADESKQTILLVEDEDFVRQVARQILCDAGYTVIAAKNAREALLAYEEHRGDTRLLMTDVVLPGESGRSLAGKIRQMDASIKVLLMSGYAEQMGLELEQHEDFLAKPFDSTQLLGRVRRLLEGGAGQIPPEKVQRIPVRRACGIA